MGDVQPITVEDARSRFRVTLAKAFPNLTANDLYFAMEGFDVAANVVRAEERAAAATREARLREALKSAVLSIDPYEWGCPTCDFFPNRASHDEDCLAYEVVQQ